MLFNNPILTVGSDMKPTTDRLNYNTLPSSVGLTDSSDIQRAGSQYGLLSSADVIGSRNKIGVYCENHRQHKIQCDNMQFLNAVPVGTPHVKRVSKNTITQ